MKSFSTFLIEATTKAKRGMQHAVDVANALVSGIQSRDKTFSINPDIFHESGHGQLETPSESGSLYKPQTKYGIKIGKPTANGSDATVFTHVWNGKNWSTTEHPIEIAQGDKIFSRYYQSEQPTAREVPQRESRKKILSDPNLPVYGESVSKKKSKNISYKGLVKSFGDLRQLARYQEVKEPTLSFDAAESNAESKTPSNKRIGTSVLVNLQAGNLRGLGFDKVKDDQPIYSRKIQRAAVKKTKSRKGRTSSQDTQLSISDVEKMMDMHDKQTLKGIDSILSGLEQEHSRIHG
jgi:hypothetical protein